MKERLANIAVLCMLLGEPIWAGYEGSSMMLYIVVALLLMAPMGLYLWLYGAK